jgi:Peptidase family M1 domain
VIRALFLALAALAAAPAPVLAGEPDATAPAYDVALRGSDRGRHWTGRETIAFTNPGIAPLDRIWVRLWGNGGWGCKGRRHVRIANVAGATAGRPSVFCSAVPLTLAAPLAPGARGSVSFDVDIRVPRAPGRFGRRGRMALFSNAIPALAHLEGGRFRLDRYFPIGEAWTYPAADWNVRLDAPPGIAVAAPGVRQADGSRRLERGRDYSFAAGRLRSRQAVIDGVTVTVWTPHRGLSKTLRITRRRLPRLAALYGPYGWPDLQIVVTDDAAMEHTGLIMTPPADFVVTHELAHEWWYALISNDQAQAPWLDEGFASYAEEAAGAQKRPWCRRPRRGARLVTRGTAFFRRNRFAGYGAVYSEGACLLDLLRKRMGAPVFDAALRDYALANRYGWSTAAEFRAAMDAASPAPLEDLWRRYRVQ